MTEIQRLEKRVLAAARAWVLSKRDYASMEKSFMDLYRAVEALESLARAEKEAKKR